MRRYIHHDLDWPRFTYQMEPLAELLSEVGFRQGLLIGRMEGLSLAPRQEATLEALVQEVRKSSEIEGESLDEAQVRSSVAKRLGLDIGGLPQATRQVDGVVAMVLDATQHHDLPLTEERIFGWHSALFPTGWSDMERITVGAWREGPMQVVSGPLGKRNVHFEAPDASRVRIEMVRFLTWFNDAEERKTVIRAAIAHFWFVTIHPFDDGNGRVGRAITDMGLAQAERKEWRCYSMSAQISKERSTYYEILEATQKGGLDITEYLRWFLLCLGRAMAAADETLTRSLLRARFWQRHAGTPFNPRQRKVLGKLFDGLDTDLTNAKWVKLTGATHDTALRDLAGLVSLGVLRKEGERKGTRYYLTDLESI